jgi:secreted trypsin-like serine protease
MAEIFSQQRLSISLLVLLVMLFFVTVQGDNSTAPPEDEIVGGNPVDSATDYPYYAYWDVVGGCGATFIAPDMLLSAAACIPDTSSKNNVLFGDSSLDIGNDLVERDVDFTIPHPDYNSFTREYDFAVLKVTGTVTPIDYVQLAQSNGMEDPMLLGELLTVIGFGLTEDGFSNTLLEVTVPYVTHDVCDSGDYTDLISEEVMVCAGEEGKDFCDGDTGGPLFDVNKVQVGVASTGFGCGEDGLPGVYARKEKLCNKEELTTDDQYIISDSTILFFPFIIRRCQCCTRLD